MKQEKVDRRVLYTKMFLRESLLALLESKPIEKITTAELCRHAGINRNTFYSHYRSPEELLNCMEEEVFQTIEASIARNTTVVDTLYAMRENLFYRKILLYPNCSRRLWDKIQQRSVDRYQKDLKKQEPHLPEETRNAVTLFIVQGSIAVVKDWLYSEMAVPPEELNQLLETLAHQCIYAAKAVPRHPS